MMQNKTNLPDNLFKMIQEQQKKDLEKFLAWLNYEKKILEEKKVE